MFLVKDPLGLISNMKNLKILGLFGSFCIKSSMHRVVVLRWLLLLTVVYFRWFKMFKKESSLLQDVKGTHVWGSLGPYVSKNYLSIWKCLEINKNAYLCELKGVWVFARTTSKEEKIANDILVYTIHKILHPISDPQ